MLKTLTICIAVLSSTAIPALAEEREDRLAVANDYITATMNDLDMPALIRQMWAPVVDQLEASGTVVSDGAREKIDALYQETFTAPMQTMMMAQDQIMADVMTLEEITALRDFYRTDAGRSVMKKLPDILAAQQPLIIGLVQEKLPIILPEIQKIIKEQ